MKSEYNTPFFKREMGSFLKVTQLTPPKNEGKKSAENDRYRLL